MGMSWYAYGLVKPSVVMSAEDETKLHLYMKHAKGEISGLAKAEWDKEADIIRVYDPVIFEQESTSAHTELDEDEVGKFIFDQYKNHGVPTHAWKCWWHKHPHGVGLCWSGTDDTQMGDFALGAGDWMLGIVGLDNHTYQARVDYYGDTFERFARLSVDELDMEVLDERFLPLSESIKAEVEAKVKEPTYVTSGITKYTDYKKHEVYGDLDAFWEHLHDDREEDKADDDLLTTTDDPLSPDCYTKAMTDGVWDLEMEEVEAMYEFLGSISAGRLTDPEWKLLQDLEERHDLEVQIAELEDEKA